METVKLDKSFGDKAVLRGFSLKLDAGSRVCLMGPSGCGKSTVVNLLLGLMKPDSGEIRGMDGLRMSAVFQENRLLEHLTAVENVRFVSRAPRDEIIGLLTQLGIDSESLPKPVQTYSGGMKRRVALCRALLSEYDVLLLDEPYKGLDEDTRKGVMALVDELTRGKTVLLVTHDEDEAAGFEIVRMG